MTPQFNFRSIAANDEPFRGMSRDISRASSVDEALHAAGWDWNVHRVPYLLHGRTKDLPSRYYGLVRGDDLYEIAPCSADYTPIQNRDLMLAFMTAANAAEIKLTRAVTLYGGARLLATAEMPVAFDLGDSTAAQAVGPRVDRSMSAQHEVRRWTTDQTVLEIVMRTGHEPGYKASVCARARRLVCENGLTLTAQFGAATVTHRGRNATLRVQRVAEAIAEAVAAFARYRQQAEILRATPSHPALDRAYVVQLLDSVAWDAIVAETQSRITSARTAPLAGTDLINAVIEETYTQKFEAALQTRSLAAVLDAIQSQPGADMARNTLWNTYNGVTYQVDHRSGRSIDAAVESSLYGQGDRLKRSALDLALVYAEAAGNPAVRGGRVIQ